MDWAPAVERLSPMLAIDRELQPKSRLYARCENNCTPSAMLASLRVGCATYSLALTDTEWRWECPKHWLRGVAHQVLHSESTVQAVAIVPKWGYWSMLWRVALIGAVCLCIYSLCRESFFTELLAFQTSSKDKFTPDSWINIRSSAGIPWTTSQNFIRSDWTCSLSFSLVCNVFF